MGARRLAVWSCSLGAAVANLCSALPALAQSVEDGAAAPAPTRPTVLFNRWQEDWSVLADPEVPREPLDNLKYIPLSSTAPKTYLSFGADVRERFEETDAPNFGVVGSRAEDYLISRVEADADLHVGSQLQAFVQLQSDFAPGKTVLTPVDQDRLDIEQAFVSVTEPLAGGALRVTVGRQQIAFDLQRFISVRDGPNVRQSYDAAWAEYKNGPWRLTGLYSQPVQNQDLRAFDDYSSRHLTYGGVRIERALFGSAQLAISYSQFTQDGARFLTASGNERRDILDVHASGKEGRFDWDVEGMNQTGHIGSEAIEAWALGSLGGYTFDKTVWTPRLGLQIDAASGDRDPHDQRLETFNPLFPNGYYMTLAGYTGYVNLIHLKLSLTLHPAKPLTLMLAAAAQWRETTADAVYTQPNITVAGTAGRPGPYTGTYGQFRADWQVSEHYAVAIEAVHFDVGSVIRAVDGHDSDYLGLELRFGW